MTKTTVLPLEDVLHCLDCFINQDSVGTIFPENFFTSLRVHLGEIELRRKQVGLMGNCLSQIETSEFAPYRIQVCASVGLVEAQQFTEEIKALGLELTNA